MRTVIEYRKKALEFESLKSKASDPALKKRYADMADCYRLLANERQRLIEEGTLVPDGND